MSFLLRNLARYAAQKLASNPQVRESAAKAARVVVDEAKEIAGKEDKARAAGRAVRRAMNKLQGNR
jgi:stage III sporulation protein SpoIIIAA